MILLCQYQNKMIKKLFTQTKNGFCKDHCKDHEKMVFTIENLINQIKEIKSILYIILGATLIPVLVQIWKVFLTPIIQAMSLK